MARAMVVVVVVAFLGLSCTTEVFTQAGTWPKCQATSTSNVRIAIRSRRNDTGTWESQIGVKQRAGAEVDQWVVDVEQTSDTCEGGDTTLETVFYLSAPSSSSDVSAPPVSPSDPPADSPQTCSCPHRPFCPPCPYSVTPSTTERPPTTPQTAPTGYELYWGVGYYKLHTQAANWLEARDTCTKEGAHLVVINSDKERDVIESLLAFNPSVTDTQYQGWLHVGGHKVGNEYVTVLGGRLVDTGYVRWSPREPSGGGETCLSVHRPDVLFNDVHCVTKLGFICEHLRKP